MRKWSLLLATLLAAPMLLATPTDATTSPTVPCSDRAGCPDLTVDGTRMSPRRTTETFASDSCSVVEGEVAAGTRTLLRFTQTTPNIGPGALIVGSPKKHPEWFTYAPCHAHYHFQQYADYRLWTPAQFAQWEALRNANPAATAADVLAANPTLTPVQGHKQGFCVIDIVNYGGARHPRYSSCMNQGISVGWADEYHSGLSGQWVDVTGLASGTYVLESEVNAERLFDEANYANDRANVTVSW